MPIHKTIQRSMVAALCAMLAAPAFAASPVDFSNPAFAQVAGRTSVPVGHSEFCRLNPGECPAYPTVVDVMELTEEHWAQLVAINNEFNSSIVPVSDQDYYQMAEYWTYPAGYGDCEDIALAKRRALIEHGWDPSTLLMAVVRETNGNGHAVLMARTDRGDMVLDNQDGTIRVWGDTPYHFLKRQSQANAAEWVDIVDDRVFMVATK